MKAAGCAERMDDGGQEAKQVSHALQPVNVGWFAVSKSPPLRDCDLLELYFSSILEMFDHSPLASAAPSSRSRRPLRFTSKALQLQ